MVGERSLQTLDLVGGAVCLDFCNTIHARYTDESVHEYLKTCADLIAWSQRAGLVSDDEAQQLRHLASMHPNAAAVTLQQAVILREVIYRLFLSHIQQHRPDEDDLGSLNIMLQETLSHRRLSWNAGQFTWQSDNTAGGLSSLLWPVVRSAAELLTSPQLKRVKECPPPDGCGWLFLDTSKNGSRRWCNMETCGNVAKVRRFRRRQDMTRE